MPSTRHQLARPCSICVRAMRTAQMGAQRVGILVVACAVRAGHHERAQQDFQQAALMKAVAKEKAKQAAQHKLLIDAAHLRQDDKDLQESSLSNLAHAFIQSQAQERVEKAQQARNGKREFLEQAQKLTTATVDAIGTKKEKTDVTGSTDQSGKC